MSGTGRDDDGDESTSVDAPIIDPFAENTNIEDIPVPRTKTDAGAPPAPPKPAVVAVMRAPTVPATDDPTAVNDVPDAELSAPDDDPLAQPPAPAVARTPTPIVPPAIVPAIPRTKTPLPAMPAIGRTPTPIPGMPAIARTKTPIPAPAPTIPRTLTPAPTTAPPPTVARTMTPVPAPPAFARTKTPVSVPPAIAPAGTTRDESGTTPPTTKEAAAITHNDSDTTPPPTTAAATARDDSDPTPPTTKAADNKGAALVSPPGPAVARTTPAAVSENKGSASSSPAVEPASANKGSDPISGPTPASDKPPSEPAARERTKTPVPAVPVTPALAFDKPPSEPAARERTKTPVPAEPATPAPASDNKEPAPAVEKSPSDAARERTKTPVPAVPATPAPASDKPPSEPGVRERTKTPPPIDPTRVPTKTPAPIEPAARERTKTPVPAVPVTLAPASDKPPSEPAARERTKTPPPIDPTRVRTKTPPPIDPVARERTKTPTPIAPLTSAPSSTGTDSPAASEAPASAEASTSQAAPRTRAMTPASAPASTGPSPTTEAATTEALAAIAATAEAPTDAPAPAAAPRTRAMTPAPAPTDAAAASTESARERTKTPAPVDRERTKTPAPTEAAAAGTSRERATTPPPGSRERTTTPPPGSREQATTPPPGRRAASVPPTDRTVTPLPVTPRPARAPSIPPSDRTTSPPSERSSPSGRTGRAEEGAESDRVEQRSLPTASIPQTEPWAHRIARIAPWVIIALPAIWQIFLLSTAITGRMTYPYDLEWMEGGMLHHAQRIQGGLGVYVPPSIEFIPYLYTPLYPSLLALFGGAFGITYTLGRVISVIALIGTSFVTGASIASARHEHVRKAPAIGGIALALGLFAAAYPYMEGWYDLVRADTFFLFMVTAAIAGLPRWATTGIGLRGHGRVAAGGVLLALAFFCKQTGIVYVAFGGLVVLVTNWRRVPAFVAMAGFIGLGGTWLLQQTTDGWFWIYIRKIHAAHDFNWDRFYKSFTNILWHFPAMSIVIGVALVIVLVTRIWKRVLPRSTHALLLWSAAFVVSTLIGAIGWGTEFAHFNAYMPAFLHGAIAAGAAVPAIYGCARVIWGPRKRAELVSSIAAVATAVPLALACWSNRWEPKKFMPTPRDVAAGDKLIARIHAIQGDVWMPSHPWYLVLAGKAPRVHRMGIKDVTWRQTRTVEGLDAALEHHAFAALILDGTDVHNAEPATISKVTQAYRAAFKIPADEKPRVFTGARVSPDSIWLPAIPARPPAGTRVLFDFEQVDWSGWTISGIAWGGRPENELAGHGLLLGATGRKYGTSMHGGDVSTGRVTSPVFPLDGVLSLELGGGTDAAKLRVELWVGDAIVATASAPPPGGDTLRRVTIDPKEYRGAEGRLVLVDDSPADHLDIDDVWITP